MLCDTWYNDTYMNISFEIIANSFKHVRKLLFWQRELNQLEIQYFPDYNIIKFIVTTELDAIE